MQVDDCRDPKDDFLLALALDRRADYLVAGDADLLALDPWRGVRIGRPVDILAAVRAYSPAPSRYRAIFSSRYSRSAWCSG